MIGGQTQLAASGFRSSKLLLWWASSCLLLASVLTGLVAAQNNAAISQGFQTKETGLTTGALVSIESQNQGQVELANTDRTSGLVGVVGSDSLVALSTNTTTVQVVTSGITQVLVSNINGSIKAGDKITTSPINGVGMRATDSTIVLGTAQQDFDNIQTNEFTLTDLKGNKQVVRTGLLSVQINVTYYAISNDTGKSFLPQFLQQIANTVAGHEVSVARVLISVLVLLLGFVSSGILLYSSVQSSIISIGRNPLSEGAVHKSLLQVGATAIGILLVMVIVVYLILTT